VACCGLRENETVNHDFSNCAIAKCVLACVLLPLPSHAYNFDLGGQVFPLNVGEPNLYYVNLGESDGATSKSFDSGVIVSALDGVSQGRVTGSIDYATGTLRSRGEASGNLGLAGAWLAMNDVLTFHLPPGLPSTTVGFTLTVEGTYSSPPPDMGYYVSGSVNITLGASSASNGGDSEASTFINRTFSGQTVVRDGEAVPISVSLSPFVDGIVGRGAGVQASYDLSNTARISLQLDPGVTFTSQSGKFLVDSGPLSSLSLKSASVAGCKSVTGTVTLSAPAPAAGTIVSISDTLTAATTPLTVTVPAGGTSKTFLVKTVPVAVAESGVVGATVGSTTLTQTLNVRPMGLASLTLTPTSVVGSQPVTGRATLECKAGPGPITVDLSSNAPTVANPVAASIVVPQGVQSGNFDVTSTPVQAKSYATIAGTSNGIAKSKKLTVNMAASVSPTSLKFGSVPVGQTSVPLNATLTNKGAVPFTVDSIALTGTYASWFAKTNNCPASLAPGASCTISVTFTPQAALTKSAKLSIATSATSTSLSVSLSGTGI
jgi:hypothetical protein